MNGKHNKKQHKIIFWNINWLSLSTIILIIEIKYKFIINVKREWNMWDCNEYFYGKIAGSSKPWRLIEDQIPKEMLSHSSPLLKSHWNWQEFPIFSPTDHPKPSHLSSREPQITVFTTQTKKLLSFVCSTKSIIIDKNPHKITCHKNWEIIHNKSWVIQLKSYREKKEILFVKRDEPETII